MPINLSVEEMEKLVDALLSCPSLADPHTRQDIINQLAQSMGASVPYRASDRAHLVQLVNTCLAYPNGFAELLKILKFYERDSFPMSHVLATWSNITLAKVPKNFSAIPVNQTPQSSKWSLWLAVGMVGILGLGSLLLMTISLVLSRGGTPVVVVTATNTVAVSSTTPTPYNMVLIPAGDFIMGSDTGGSNEKPVHIVYLKDYYIDKYETTNAEYAQCVNAGKCTVPNCDEYKKSEKTNHPVVCINWTQAKNYCEFMGKRLPTEAEWEKAARGTDGRIYPWGNQFDGTKLNFCDKNCTVVLADKTVDDGYADTAPVGSYPSGVSRYGVLDMAGNVWEWTSSDYKPYPYKADDNRDDLLSDNIKVIRGGSWFNYGNLARAASRLDGNLTFSGSYIGSRCAQ